MTFADLPLLSSIQKSLDALGFTKPTDIQSKLIPLLLEDPKRDVHAQAQTGTGKTLAFGIPLLHTIDVESSQVQGLVVAPTRELVLQIYENLKEVSRESNISIVPIYGGMPIERQIAKIKRGAQIIVGTPGRLNDHLRRKTLSLKNVHALVLDEADIMLDMGFKEEIDDILNYTPKDRQIWLLSATVRRGIKQLITSHMNNVLSVIAPKQNVVSTQVAQYYCVVPGRKRFEAIARFIEATPSFYGIIFAQTKALTAEIMEKLVSKGFKANCLHGDMKQALRNQVIKGFKNKDFTVMVATDVAARGIDVEDLSHVINYTLPDEHESYIHRIGRTGRAGKQGSAISLVTKSEMRRVKQLEKRAHTTLQEIPVPPIDTIINAKMSAVSDFIEQAKTHTKKLSDVQKSLAELIASFTADELRSALLQTLEEKFFKGVVDVDFTCVGPDLVAMPQEICLEAGQNKGLDEELVRDYLYSTCQLLPQDLRKVRVLKKLTFISLPENKLEECMSTIKSNPITGSKVKVYLVEDTFPARRRRAPGRSSRFRGGRSSRGSSRRSNNR